MAIVIVPQFLDILSHFFHIYCFLFTFPFRKFLLTHLRTWFLSSAMSSLLASPSKTSSFLLYCFWLPFDSLSSHFSAYIIHLFYDDAFQALSLVYSFNNIMNFHLLKFFIDRMVWSCEKQKRYPDSSRKCANDCLIIRELSYENDQLRLATA